LSLQGRNNPSCLPTGRVVVRRRAFNVDCDGVKAPACGRQVSLLYKILTPACGRQGLTPRINSNLPVACLPVGRVDRLVAVVFAQPLKVATTLLKDD